MGFTTEKDHPTADSRGQQPGGGAELGGVRRALRAADDGTEPGQSLGGTPPGASTAERRGS